MIKGVHHTCITVSNIDEALAFYKDTLGLKQTMDFEIADEAFDKIFNIKGFRARFVYFEEGLEIVYYYPPVEGKAPSISPFDFGYTFAILQVDDLDAAYANLVKKGVKFDAPPQVPKALVPTEGSVKVAHMRGPDNVKLSLVQLSKSQG
jgi:catechol 2,3-dioxygenase-like lactoylglutathione lyase family enzyme